MKRRNALLAESRRTRASLLLELASKKKVPVTVIMTPYRNSKNRVILQLVRTTYVVRNGTKYRYGPIARSPKNLLRSAPRQLRS